jgi:7,8-dihydropterin-6-yl-methyl-4-(beta-D-ribofuranosyl)aminobenzene 5'-phosphate synthase
MFFVTLVSFLLVMGIAGVGLADSGGKLKLSVLCDDTAASDKFVDEHGLSILVELPIGQRWLSDTGTTDIFLQNARKMGLSPDNLTGITISHGHDDHTDGLTFAGQ